MSTHQDVARFGSQATESSPQLHLRLLGQFELATADGGRVNIANRKGRALLAYLAMARGQRQARGHLATLLWGESSEARARQSLRQTIHSLRAPLSAAGLALLTEDDLVSLAPRRISVDALELEQLARAPDDLSQARAIELYHGDFLCSFDDAGPSFEDWRMAQSMHFREVVHVCMERRLQVLEPERKLDLAVSLGLRMLRLEPLAERSHRTLMRLYSAQGRRVEALRQYARCRKLLADELAETPEDETVALFQAIRKHRPRVRSPGDRVLQPVPVYCRSCLQPTTEHQHAFVSESACPTSSDRHGGVGVPALLGECLQ